MILALSAVLATLAGAEPDLRRFEAEERHMGTTFRIVLYASDESVAKQAFAAAFERIAEVDRTCSDYDSESELSRLSTGSPHEKPVPVSPLLADVLNRSKEWSKRTDGAFDVTVGPLTKLWRRARRQKELPAADDLRAARAAVGWRSLEVDNDRKLARLAKPGMRLDLGGIGQGYAVDLAMTELRKQGHTIALIDGSGDVLVGDAPPGTTGWDIAVAKVDPNEPPQRRFRMANKSVSTSGDAFQFVEIAGRRYSHIVDPKSGLGLSLRASVTVVAPDATTADALATAACVLGLDKGPKLVDVVDGCECLFVAVDDEGKTIVRETDGFPK